MIEIVDGVDLEIRLENAENGYCGQDDGGSMRVDYVTEIMEEREK